MIVFWLICQTVITVCYGYVDQTYRRQSVISAADVLPGFKERKARSGKSMRQYPYNFSQNPASRAQYSLCGGRVLFHIFLLVETTELVYNVRQCENGFFAG